jgi:TRAP-type C4-dicarboxylate transport system permease small subunit
MGKIETAVGHLVQGTRLIAALGLVVGVLLNFANIVGRYFLNAPISWADEVMLFIMVGIVFFGVVGVSWDDKHIRMDIVVELLPPPLRRVVTFLVRLAEIAVSLILVYLSIPVIDQLYRFDQRSQAAEMPLVIPQIVVPVCLFLVAIAGVARLLSGRERNPADAS